MTKESSKPRPNRPLTATTLLFVTVLVNLWLHYDPALLEKGLLQSSYWWDYSWHSHKYTTITSMSVSLFTHADWEHVLGNMFLLWLAGRQVFVGLPCWTSPWAFVWIYFGSQVSSMAGCRLLSYGLDLEWQRKLVRGRHEWSNWVPISWRDVWWTVSNVSQAAQLRVWQYTPGIGASAAVFGVVGAQIYTALCSQRHPASMDVMTQLLWLTLITKEVFGTPFSLDQLSTVLDDNVDHAAHLCGALGGFLLAAVWDYWNPTRNVAARTQPRSVVVENHGVS